MELTIKTPQAKYEFPACISVSASEIIYSKKLIDLLRITPQQRAVFATDEKGDWYVSFTDDPTEGIAVHERYNKYRKGKQGQEWTQRQLRSHDRNLSRQILAEVNQACIAATLLVSPKPIRFNERNWYKFTTKRPFKMREF